MTIKDCVAQALRTNPDEGFQKLSLDCFVVALPRNDGEAPHRFCFSRAEKSTFATSITALVRV